MSKELEKDIEALQKELEGEFGKDAVQRLDSPEALSKITGSVSSGSIIVDKILGGGRPEPHTLIPFGRQTSIAGLNGSGKSTLIAQIAANIQKQDGIVVAVDTEERIDEVYWGNLGVDTAKVINLHGESIEDVFTKQFKVIDQIKKLAPDRPLMLIWDSVGATSSQLLRDSDDPMGETAMLKDVRALSQGMKVVNMKIAQSKVCYVYSNHLYRNTSGYGETWVEPGGEKLKFFATVRLMLTKIGDIDEEDSVGNKVIIGQKVRIKSLKNSMAPKRMEMEAAMLGGKGFNDAYSIFELASKLKLITRSVWSSWTSPDGEVVKFQAFAGFVEKVTKHPKYQTLVNQVFDRLVG